MSDEELQKKKKATGRQFLKVFLFRLGQLLFSFLMSVMVARMLGPEIKGVLGVVFTFIGTSGFLFSFGLSSSLIYHSGRSLYSAGELLSGALFWMLALVAVYLPSAAAFYYLFGQSVLKGIDPQYFFFALLLFPLFLLNLISGSIAKATGKIEQAAAVVFIKEAVFFAAMVAAVMVFNKGAGWIISARLAGDFFGMLLMFFVIRKKIKTRDLLPSFNGRMTRDVFRYGFKSYFGSVLQPYNHKSDVFILNYFLGPVFVGVYSVGLSLAEYLLILPSVVCFVLLPKVASAAPRDGAEYAVSFSRRTVWLMLFSGLTVLSLLQWLIPLLFGPAFNEARYATYILFPGTLMLALTWILGAFFEGIGKPELLMRANLLVFVLNLVLNVLLIPLWGFKGCAAASTFAYILSALFLVSSFKKETGMGWLHLVEFRRSDFSPARIIKDLGFRGAS
jgi:O-antigen/teichoic acid export membrane protein